MSERPCETIAVAVSEVNDNIESVLSTRVYNVRAASRDYCTDTCDADVARVRVVAEGRVSAILNRATNVSLFKDAMSGYLGLPSASFSFSNSFRNWRHSCSSTNARLRSASFRSLRMAEIARPIGPNVDKSNHRTAVELEELSTVLVLDAWEELPRVGLVQGNPSGD